MNHELQPQTLAPEQAKVQHLGEQSIGFALKMRRMASVGALSTLAVFGGTAKLEKADAAVGGPVFPPITQVIDGKEPQFNGSAVMEGIHASDCKDLGSIAYPGETHFTRNPRHRRNIVTAKFSLDSFMECNGYGRASRFLRVDTKNSKQQRYVRGTTYALKDHRPFVMRNGSLVNGTKFMKIGQDCKRNQTLTARHVQIVLYEHMDGTKSRKVYADIPRKINCR